MLYLRGGSRSPNTIRAYTRAVATFLTWCERTGVSWRAASLGQLARFKTRLESTPTPSGRERSGRSVDLVLTGMCEFLRFTAASGLADPSVAAQLSERRYLAHLPRAFDVGENGQFRTIRARVLRSRAVSPPPATLTGEQIAAVVAGCSTARDRFVVRALHETGMRIGEFLGLRLAHLHLLPDSAALGCRVAGAHLHVPARGECSNGARSKSGSRIVPVAAGVVADYRDYRAERFDILGETDRCDFVLVNLAGPHAGRPMTDSNVRQLLGRLGRQCGFRVTPHMFRHTAATGWLAAGVSADVVQSLLGHASASTLAIYSHPSDAATRAAVEHVHESRLR
ncbi:MAG: tyrosine-type recombinase/integrase [Nakamurella sp.]